jgi:4-hydroxybenzoate polyprenyltransferase
VDLDYTLVRTDTLLESVAGCVRHAPGALLALPGWLLQGRAVLKARLAERVSLDPAGLPYNAPLLEHLRAEHARGRPLVLATAADHRIAQAVADHLGLFSQVIASTPGRNLKGRHKLEAIQAALGTRFAYAGDARADLPIWRAAAGAVLVGVPTAVRREVAANVPVERDIVHQRAELRTWLRALRWHQWSKNALLFVPLLTSFRFGDPARVAHVLLAFLAFSAVASATYLFNDLLDLPNDRRHRTKRHRPLAAGDLRLPAAVAAMVALLAAGLALGAAIGTLFLACLLIYLVGTVTYSTWLKRLLILDVVCLAALYTVRIVAGAAAIAVPLSVWLAAFSVFIFFSLGLLKRCTELQLLGDEAGAAVPGRGYRPADLRVLLPLGAAAALCAVAMYGLFLAAPRTQAVYAAPDLLWVGALVLLYWVTRVWLKAARGEVHDDPVVFALRDRTSRLTVLVIAGVLIAARYLPLPTFLQ